MNSAYIRDKTESEKHVKNNHSVTPEKPRNRAVLRKNKLQYVRAVQREKRNKVKQKQSDIQKNAVYEIYAERIKQNVENRRRRYRRRSHRRNHADEIIQSREKKAENDIDRHARNRYEKDRGSVILFEPGRIYRDGFSPADSEQKHTYRSDEIEVIFRIKTESAAEFCRIVAAFKSNVAVRVLVKNQSGKKRANVSYKRKKTVGRFHSMSDDLSYSRFGRICKKTEKERSSTSPLIVRMSSSDDISYIVLQPLYFVNPILQKY